MSGKHSVVQRNLTRKSPFVKPYNSFNIFLKRELQNKQNIYIVSRDSESSSQQHFQPVTNTSALVARSKHFQSLMGYRNRSKVLAPGLLF